MKKALLVLIEVALSAAILSTPAKAHWTLEGFLGSAWSVPTPLSIHQWGEERIYLIAKYHTEPFRESPYYAWRLAKWSKNRAWEFELVHHKLYLSNPPAEVQHFEVSHGYNLITINRAWLLRGFIWRFGAGLVAAHPETTVRGKTLPWGKGLNGFYISGLTVQAGIEKKFSLWRRLFAVLEAKFTASYAIIPIQDGDAYVPNAALHGLFGLGYRF
jgi:hypothetical protein